jgi:translation initiation factor 4E
VQIIVFMISDMTWQFNSDDRPPMNKFLSIQAVPQTSYRSSFRNSPATGPGEGPGPIGGPQTPSTRFGAGGGGGVFGKR